MFELGKLYRRRDLHAEFGGSRQGGIVTLKHHPMVWLITGAGGSSFGYDDEQLEDGTFLYYGAGQSGDMEFLRGNRAIRDHAADGNDLHLFKRGTGDQATHLRYAGQMVCAGYELRAGVPDGHGEPRTAIIFQLAPADEDTADNEQSAASIAGLTLDELRLAAVGQVEVNVPPYVAKRNVYLRSAAVRAYVLERAAGNCEGCGEGAPFLTRAGKPYLEPHHARRLSDGGPDHPQWVIALCPNCHRRAHHAGDGEAYNDGLIAVLKTLEPASANTK